MSNLAAVVLERLGRERIDSAERNALDSALAAQLARAQAAWPEVKQPVEPVLSLAAERIALAASDAPLIDQIAELRMPDLYIAAACAAGDGAALRAFDSRYFQKLGAVLARFGGEPVADEVRQILREKLFVTTPSRRARILEFAGKSDLAGLVRIAAVRTALNLQRSVRHQEAVGEADLLMASLALDPEAERRLDQQVANEVKRAFQDSLGELSPRERNVLRMSLLHQLSIDVIGRIHGVHRATAARWLVDIRTQLRNGTRKRLQERLATSRDEIDNLIALVQSQLDLSFERILDEPDGSSGPDPSPGAGGAGAGGAGRVDDAAAERSGAQR
jgi:RNA polymerase sigma-70 factor, ECF subfamily